MSTDESGSHAVLRGRGITSTHLLLVAILALALGLRLFHLGTSDMWHERLQQTSGATAEQP